MKSIHVTQMLSRIVCLENACTLPKLCVYRGIQKYLNDTAVFGEKFFKISFDMVIVYKIQRNSYTLLEYSVEQFVQKISAQCRKCVGTETHRRIMKHCGQKSVFTWYNSQIKSDCRNISEALNWTRKFFDVSISVCLSVCDETAVLAKCLISRIPI